MKEIVETKDTWLASFLLCKGAKLTNITVIPGTKIAVITVTGDDLSQLREEFFDGGTVPAREYKMSVNNLKHQIFDKLGRMNHGSYRQERTH